MNSFNIRIHSISMCWLAMPLGAGVLRWVLACRTFFYLDFQQISDSSVAKVAVLQGTGSPH